MTSLTDYERIEAYRLAAKGLGHEDISVKLGIGYAAGRERVRAIVLRKPLPKVPQDVMLANARPRTQTFRTRQLASVANRAAPITLPRISILGDDQ